MDPYLEQFWGDVHHTMITVSRAAIQKQLPSGLVARVDERVFVETPEGEPRDIIPDVRVVERGRGDDEPARRAGNGIAVAEPFIIRLAHDEPARQGFIEIIDIKSGRRVVTVIEILRPSNKVPGPGRDLYLQKQEELKLGRIGLVEINLTRKGGHVLAVPFDRIPSGHRTPYATCVRRGWKHLEIEYYAMSLRERLPVIGIALRLQDRDIPLDLQAVLDECCEEGRYVDDIDYHEDPEPPLSPDDARWADELLRQRGLR
jgi:hypothetical protein